MKKRFIGICILLAMCLTLLPLSAFADGAPAQMDTLIVAYPSFTGSFSPFYTETSYDQDVWAMTQISLLSSDRCGAVITSGIDGQTVGYNGKDYTYYGPADLTITKNDDGTVDYDFTLRDDVMFSDGEPLTVDDVIFTMYVLCDPTYDGSSSFSSLPIEGLNDYRSGMDSRGHVIFQIGSDEYVETGFFTETQYTQFWDYYNNRAGIAFAQSIVDYCIANYASYGASDVASAASLWGYELEAEATAEDFWNAMLENHNGDVNEVERYEGIGKTLLQLTIASDPAFQVGVKVGESAPNITGIKKTGANSLRIHMTEFDVTAVYRLSVSIVPMHYYGNTELYDYENDSFGFTKGDLSGVRAKTSAPIGAGPYKFVSYENGEVSFAANEYYYLGAPKIPNVVFKQANDGDLVSGVASGVYDIAEPSFSVQNIDAIKQCNSNGELTGDKITTVTTDNLGYGYIGIAASRVNVGGTKDSEASKNLRKAIATVLAVYRDVSVSSYYGDCASVINYPISNSSWAAPHPEEEGYQVAFSTDADGAPIYTHGMSEEDKYAAALEASLGFFEAAGYTVEDGKLTSAPEGAKLSYEIWIPGDGTGDHPSFLNATKARDAFAAIGFDFVVKDLTDSSDLWDGLDSDSVDMWCAAWGASVDPDMYQIYYSTNIVGEPGSTGSNHYFIQDDELDELIMAGREKADTAERKAIYKQCLDIIMDWAVEVPVYQRQNAYIFSSMRINIDTLPMITTFYDWTAEIQNLELNAAKPEEPVEEVSAVYTENGTDDAVMMEDIRAGGELTVVFVSDSDVPVVRTALEAIYDANGRFLCVRQLEVELSASSATVVNFSFENAENAAVAKIMLVDSADFEPLIRQIVIQLTPAGN